MEEKAEDEKHNGSFSIEKEAEMLFDQKILEHKVEAAEKNTRL